MVRLAKTMVILVVTITLAACEKGGKGDENPLNPSVPVVLPVMTDFDYIRQGVGEDPARGANQIGISWNGGVGVCTVPGNATWNDATKNLQCTKGGEPVEIPLNTKLHGEVVDWAFKVNVTQGVRFRTTLLPSSGDFMLTVDPDGNVVVK